MENGEKSSRDFLYRGEPWPLDSTMGGPVKHIVKKILSTVELGAGKKRP